MIKKRTIAVILTFTVSFLLAGTSFAFIAKKEVNSVQYRILMNCDYAVAFYKTFSPAENAKVEDSFLGRPAKIALWRTFADNKNLKTVELPSSVQIVCGGNFLEDKFLEHVPPLENNAVYVPADNYDDYRAACEKGLFNRLDKNMRLIAVKKQNG
ncbi:MAG: hypothetical protein FWC57_02600 [Endomicrobia bacterium]|nr:hypothetical protein [Endomicrobiia bacterium]